MSQRTLSADAGIAAQPQPKEFVLSRTFDAPLDRVWRAWTTRAELMEWFSPRGFKTIAAKLDFRPGGMFHYCIAAPDGTELWGKFDYREIIPQQRIVLVNSFSDEDGGITRHPFSATWPLQMHSTSEFAEQNGKTTLTIRWLPLDASAVEIETFNNAHDSCRQGWTGTFDQLSAFLSRPE